MASSTEKKNNAMKRKPKSCSDEVRLGPAEEKERVAEESMFCRLAFASFLEIANDRMS